MLSYNLIKRWAYIWTWEYSNKYSCYLIFTIKIFLKIFVIWFLNSDLINIAKDRDIVFVSYLHITTTTTTLVLTRNIC